MDKTFRWYAVYTKSKNEKKVSQYLMEKEIEEYLPLLKTLRQWSDRKKMVVEPLFKSYIFVRTNNKGYLEVLNTQGVVCFVTIGHEKIAIPDYQIEAIKTYLGQNDFEDTNVQFEKGVEVEVMEGTLKGLRGTLIRVRNNRKLLVQIDAINQNILLTLPAHLLREIPKKDPN